MMVKLLINLNVLVIPHERLSETIINLTHITDDMLTDAPEIEEVLLNLKNGLETPFL